MTRRRLRLLILDNEYNPDWRTRDSRNSGLYRALEDEFDIVDARTPRVPMTTETLIRLRYFYPQRTRWRRRAGLNAQSFRARTLAAGSIITSHAGEFDVVLQLYSLYAPGACPSPPTALYLDSTLAISHREYPAAVPIAGRGRSAWMKLEGEMYRRAEALLPMSRLVADSLINDYGCDPSRVEVVGAGTNLLPPTLAGKTWEHPIALFVGLDWVRKGGPELLAAWPEVRKVVPDAELLLVGPTPPRLPPGVRALGRLGSTDLAACYRSARTFVLPSRFDPFPHALREAMGHGLACVATRQAACAEIVTDGTTGLLVDRADPAALAEAMCCLLANPERSEAMGLEARKAVTRAMRWEDVAARMTPAIHSAYRRRQSTSR